MSENAYKLVTTCIMCGTVGFVVLLVAVFINADTLARAYRRLTAPAKCDWCHGSGKYNGHDCDRCDGAGERA